MYLRIGIVLIVMLNKSASEYQSILCCAILFFSFRTFTPAAQREGLVHI